LLKKGIVMLARVAIKHLTSLIIIAGILSGCSHKNLLDSDTCGKPLIYSRAEKANLARSMIRELGSHAVQFIERGDRITLIVPTDRYYIFNSPELNDLEFPTLNNIAKLIKLFPCSRVTVASFSDDVGKRVIREKLTKARAMSMLTFLWAKGVPAQFLTDESFGSHFAVGNNAIIHGSAYNRRIEIQWWAGKNPPPPAPKADRMDMKMK
jgi:outer membrane protein OmpA-like peptidoglycan-associated protein